MYSNFLTGNTHTTITIGWQAPPSNLLDYIQYYELQVSESGENASIIEEAIHPQNNRNLPYMFDNVSSKITNHCYKLINKSSFISCERQPNTSSKYVLAAS